MGIIKDSATDEEDYENEDYEDDDFDEDEDNFKVCLKWYMVCVENSSWVCKVTESIENPKWPQQQAGN